MSKQGTDITVESLRKRLSENLPDYMVPSIVCKDRNNATDSETERLIKEAKPEPQGNIETTKEYQAPHTC